MALSFYLGNIGLEGAVQSPCLHVLRDQSLSPENMEGKTLFRGSKVLVQDFVGLWNAKWHWHREQPGTMQPDGSSHLQHVILDFVNNGQASPVCTGSVCFGERLNRY